MDQNYGGFIIYEESSQVNLTKPKKKSLISVSEHQVRAVNEVG